jgi:putative ABC transport system permease protein
MGLAALLRETFRIARRALVANRLRTLLALLGIVIGVATVIAMASLINGFRRSFERGIQSFSSNTIYIRPFRPGIQFLAGFPDSLRKRQPFSMDDAAAILERSPNVAAISPVKLFMGDLRLEYRSRSTRGTQTFGTSDGFLRTRGFDVEQGRFFTPEEVRRRASVLVLGRDTYESLFRDANGLGRTVHVGGRPFTVIGVFSVRGRFLGSNLDDVACLPWSSGDKFWAPSPGAPPWFAKKGFVWLDAVPVSADRTQAAMQEVRAVLRLRRHLPASRGDDFEVFSDDALLAIYQAITGGISALMLIISSIALLVGGIGVMNIMLVAVTERTHEIGLRKALGAPRRAILLQFLLEAVLLTMLGGALGILLGAGVSLAVRAASDLPTYVSWGSVALSTIVATSIGVFFGLYPAMRASRLDPVDALRYE